MNDDLPMSVQEIAEVIGRHEALMLIGKLPRCYSGGDGKKCSKVILYVPKRLPPDHRLVSILGWHTALKLVRVFGGEILYPANCAYLESRLRNQRIVEMLGEGFSAARIAEEFGVTAQHVRVLGKAKKPPEETKPHRHNHAG